MHHCLSTIVAPAGLLISSAVTDSFDLVCVPQESQQLQQLQELQGELLSSRAELESLKVSVTSSQQVPIMHCVCVSSCSRVQ